MAVSKVIYAGDTLIDLTEDTVTPETLAKGITAHDKTGAPIVGTMESGGSGGGAPDLPDGYMHAGYIRFNDAQIVDTGIIGTQDTKIKVIFTREDDAGMYLYGCASSGNTASITAYLSSSGSWRFGAKSANRALTADPELVHTSIQSKTGVVAISPNNTYSGVTAFETVGSLLIGSARNSSGTVGVASYVGKIFLFQMWEGSTEVLHLSPVVSTDGVYRFYDKVSGNFFDSITDTPLDGGTL